MSVRLLALLAVILAFGALTVLALMEAGYFGIFLQHFENYAGMQVLTDLVIVCVLGIVWMLHDGKTSGVTPWPFVVLTLAAGAFGILFYLVAREIKSRAAT
ncbi:DUF2834 domain-containing protein [Parvibaculum sp.]|uniref:DUF2834 domain-containing protein n=1 Tax=Parvibaculum sp. TaxID=2024848 RepID=UPI00391CF8B8